MLLLLLALLAPAEAADYTQFRAAVVGGDVPTTFDPETGENVAWTAELRGRGLSTPLVIGDRVFVTYCDGLNQERLGVACYDDASGELIWRREFWATGRPVAHRKSSNAAPTPTSDGERVFAFWSSGDLVAIDFGGVVQWVRGLQADYPNASNSLGMSSSLVTADGVVVAQLEADAESVAFGIDAIDGTNRWVLPDRPKKANWTSPSIATADGRSLVMLQSSRGVSAVDIATGSEVWNYDDGASTIPSTFVTGDVVLVPSNGITALEAASGKPLWNESKLSIGTATPYVLADRLFTINRQGVLTTSDLGSGQTLGKVRVEGPYSASPVAAGERLYLVNEDGTVKVVDVSGDDAEIVHETDFGETILATPAVRGDALYLRSDGHLWKVAPTDAN